MSTPYIPRRWNHDGTRNVYCSECHRYISTLSGSDQSFGSALCAICAAAKDGEVLPADVVDALTSTMRFRDGVIAPAYTMGPEPSTITDPMSGNLPAASGFVSHYIKVIKNNVFKVAGAALAKSKEPSSKKLAREKKKTRVFSHEDKESTFIEFNNDKKE